MDLYGQDAEVRLLSRLAARLDHPTMIDVGAEQGSMARSMLDVGVQELHAFDPHPRNADALRKLFDHEPRARVHELALGDKDGNAGLHISTSPAGEVLPFGHTLLERPDTDEIAWTETIAVTLRSLQSLIEDGQIPSRIGILKIDTEGHDLAVVKGMGELEADIVMVEQWTDLPHGLGLCPWTIEDMVAALRGRGFGHFAFIIHRGEFVTLKWDDGYAEPGTMGNLVFLHDRVLTRLLPEVLACAGELSEEAVRIGQGYVSAARQRLEMLDELKRAADDRQQTVQELKQAADDRLAVMEELKRAADERLVIVEELRRVATARLQALHAANARMTSQDAELQALRHADR